MKNKKIKYLTTLSLSNLMLQTFVLLIIPLISITVSATEFDENGTEEVEMLPSETNENNEMTEIPPVFNFTQSSLKTKVNEVINLSFESNQEVNEVVVRLPKEAVIINRETNNAVFLEERQDGKLWFLQYQSFQKAFSMEILFDEPGVYEAFAGDSRITIVVDNISESDLTFEQRVNHEVSNETDNIGLLDEENEKNLLENSKFQYTRGVSTRIPNWELSSSTTPVNQLTRNLTISQVTSNGWNQLSDTNFWIGGGSDALNMSRAAGTRTLLISQTIPTVRNQKYKISIRARSADGNARLTMTAYAGTGNIAGSNPVGSTGFDLIGSNVNEFATYTLNFTATSNLTTIGFRTAGAHTLFSEAAVVPEYYSLALEASPSTGGEPHTDKTGLLLGDTASLTANPNSGYQFSHWEIVSGRGADLSSPSDAETMFVMGSEDTIVRAVYEEDEEATVYVQYLDTDGKEIAESQVLTGIIGEEYQTEAKFIENYQLLNTPYNASGFFNESLIFVTYVYELEEIEPMDPIIPGEIISPENMPDLPQDQGLFSIDFISRFNFGAQYISAKKAVYYANPQRLVDEDGTVISDEVRPNFIQISDRRDKGDRSGWQLAVTQRGQFSSNTGHQLLGSSVQMNNIQALSVQGGEYVPTPVQDSIELIPDMKQVLLSVPENEESGTWIYRFGDMDTARNSVALVIPRGTNPENSQYNTTFDWELSSVPAN